MLNWQDNRKTSIGCFSLWLLLITYMAIHISKTQVTPYGAGNIREFVEDRWLVFVSMFLNVGIMAAIAKRINSTRRERENALNDASQQLQENYRIKEAFNLQLQEEVDLQTEQLKNQNQLLLSQAEALRNADAEKSRLFAGISHELRTPITLIQGPLELMKTQAQLKGSDKNNLDMALRNTKHLHNFAEEILDLSTTNKGGLRIQQKSIDVSLWLKELVSEFSFSAKEKNIQLDLHCQSHVTSNIDPKQFRKAISILLHNALKFTPKNGSIRVSLAVINDKLVFEFVDSGPGLSQQDKKLCFDLFYQSPAHSQIEGTGIGLNLAKEITARHEGEIIADNNRQGGATFTIKLPHNSNKQVISINRYHDVNTWQPEPSSLQTQAPYVLYVEDNKDMRDYINHSLKKNFIVCSVSNGEEALESINNRIPDLVLTDWMMPKMDGISLLNRIRDDEVTATLPVIILSGASSIEKKRLGYASLADDYLVKPVDTEELILKIFAAIRYHQKMSSVCPPSISPVIIHKDKATNDPYIAAIESIIEKNLSDTFFDSEILASTMNTTLKTLSRKLDKITGLTPGLFIREYRLTKALEFQKQEKFSTKKELAFAVGFKSSAYFNKLLKQFSEL